MHRVSVDAARALKNRWGTRTGNTRTDGRYLYLHGHVIAEYEDTGRVRVTLAGHPTATTIDRINAVLMEFDTGAVVTMEHEQPRLYRTSAGWSENTMTPMDPNRWYSFRAR